MKPHNPNITYPVHERYISVSIPHTASGLMERTVYDDLKPRIQQLSPASRTLIDKIIAFERLESKFTKDKIHPLAELEEKQRANFQAELTNRGINDFTAAKAVCADMRSGGVGYAMPVYNVNSHSVMGFHFDDNGELKGACKIYDPKPVKAPKPTR